MEFWNVVWCAYNSAAFSAMTNIAMLGALALIIPALSTLPSLPDPEEEESYTLRIDFKKTRRRVKICAAVALIIAVLPPLLYGSVLAGMGGETCKVTVPLTAYVYSNLFFLCVSTLAVVVLYALFYFTWQNLRRIYAEATQKTARAGSNN